MDRNTSEGDVAAGDLEAIPAGLEKKNVNNPPWRKTPLEKSEAEPRLTWRKGASRGAAEPGC